MSNRTQTIEVEVTIQRGKPGTRGRKGSNGNVASPRIPRITRLMALAIKFQEMADRGEIRDYADIARLGYVTRARMTQIINLLLLAPEFQSTLLLDIWRLEANYTVTERDLRLISAHPIWADQRVLVAAQCPGLLASRAMPARQSTNTTR